MLEGKLDAALNDQVLQIHVALVELHGFHSHGNNFLPLRP